MTGYIKLYRQMADYALWIRGRFSRGQAWADLLMRAAHKDHIAIQGNRAIPVKRGQVLAPQLGLAKRWDWDRETVRSFLLLLKSLNMVAIKTSKATDTGYTLITILNYERFQGDGHIQSDEASRIESGIESRIEPASNQLPTSTIKNEKKGKKKDPPKKSFSFEEYARPPKPSPVPGRLERRGGDERRDALDA